MFHHVPYETYFRRELYIFERKFLENCFSEVIDKLLLKLF